MQVLDLEVGIDFGESGNLREFSPAGFSPNSDRVSTWSAAGTAELAFRLPPRRHDLRFTIEVFPYLGDDKIAQQSCWIFFNGLFVHYETVKTPVEMTFTVSRDLFRPLANRLSFVLPDATAPHALEMGDDLRLLGLSFVKLRAGEPNAAAPNPPQVASRDRAEPARPQPPRNRRSSP